MELTLEQFLEAVVKELKKRELQFCLVGGLAASGYRDEERLTKDLDFLIRAENEIEIAREILKTFKLSALVVRKANLDGGPHFAIKKSNTEPRIVAGRDKDNPRKIGLDFLLSTFPWFDNAIERAQFNKIDFGFSLIPTIAVEDLIICKLYALNSTNKREKDIDDIRSIFKADNVIDLSYLVSEMQRLELILPDSLEGDTPKEITKISKKIKKLKCK